MAGPPVSRPSTWASCGVMHLTGDPEGPPLAIPWHEASRLDALTGHFGVDTALLAERSATASLRRQGRCSCGGATHLMRAGERWVAMSLARADDLALLPALLGLEVSDFDEAWAKLAPEIELRSALELEERAALLGVCLSVVGATPGPMTVSGNPRPGARMPRAPLVVDLSALWAGPLCAHLLQLAGARVIKVEDTARPDGARTGVAQFFELLNQGKRSVALDFRSSTGRSHLFELLSAADVVVTSSRARAFEQLGIAVDGVLATASDKVWTAISAYGWASNRVGYGDDVAAGAGLVAWHPLDGEPRFAGDAIADPLCGIEAAALTLGCLARGGRWFVDASLAGAALRAASPPAAAAMATLQDGRWFFEGEPVEGPRARSPVLPTPPLGSDTECVLAQVVAL